MNLTLAKRFGGPQEASVIGTDYKVSLPTAALVNGELMFTLDYTATIAGGNEPSYVIPPFWQWPKAKEPPVKTLL